MKTQKNVTDCYYLGCIIAHGATVDLWLLRVVIRGALWMFAKQLSNFLQCSAFGLDKYQVDAKMEVLNMP